MSADPVEDIADALVTFLENAENWSAPPSLKFTVIKDATPEIHLEKIKTTTVFVIPFGEAAEKIGRGGQALETYQVFTMVYRPMDSEFTRQLLSKLSRELKLAIRGATRMAGCVWTGDETSVKFNPQVGKDSKAFVDGTQFSYAGIR